MEQKIKHFGVITPDLKTFYFWKDQNAKKELYHVYFPIITENHIYQQHITNVIAINNDGRHNSREEELYILCETKIKELEVK